MNKLLRDLWSSVAMNAEGAGGGGDAPKTTESVLYPDDKPTGDKPAEGDAPAEKPASEPAGDWKEYEPDASKSDEENAAAKAEHDKTKPAAPDDAALDTVPEDGKYAVTMPEGIPLDQAALDRFSPKFKELGLTNRQVQGIVAEEAARRKEEYENYANTPEGGWSMAAHEYFTKNGTPEKWAENAKADKDIGGAKWDATTAAAKRAVTTLGTPELKEFFEATGGGNHPELIRFMAKVGAMIKEDNPASGSLPGNTGKDRAAILYPDDQPKG